MQSHLRGDNFVSIKMKIFSIHIQMHIEVVKYIFMILIFVSICQVFGDPLRDKLHGHVTSNGRKEPIASLVIIGAVKEYITVTEGQIVTIRCVVQGDQKTDKTWLKVCTGFHYISCLEIHTKKLD